MNSLINLILIKHLTAKEGNPMKKTVLDDVQISKNALVTVTEMNHIVEVQHMEKMNTCNHIKKLNADSYVDLKTGEVKEFERTENRSQGLNSLRQTFKKLRYLVNNNFTGKGNELFITLTYRGDLQTNDHLKVGKDYDNFLKRLKRRLNKKLGSIDAIRVLEPHESGNWHLHVLLRFNDLSSVYILNEELAEIWGHGFVQIQSLKDVDNVGAYVSAYLADIEVPEEFGDHPDLVEKEVNGQKKKFLKGARLRFYPTGVNIFAKTKGMVYPEREQMTYEKALKKVGAATPHFKKSIAISDDENGFENTITYEQYNLKRTKNE